MALHWVVLMLIIVGGPALRRVADQPPPVMPGVNERLNEALGSEGGVQVYQDPAGNVGTVIDIPGGDRRFTVQPPASQWFNLGPPLQLNQRPFTGPSEAPPQLLTPDLPQIVQ
jgi:hypothetical protein